MRTGLIAGTVLVVWCGTACREKSVRMDESLSRDLGRAAARDTMELALAHSGGRGQDVMSAIEQVPAKPAAHAPVPRMPKTPPKPNIGEPRIGITPGASTPEPASAPQMTSLQQGPAALSLPSTQGQGRVQIRVSQETRPGADDFDRNVLGFVSAITTNETAAAFYRYEKLGPNYGHSVPKLSANTSHLFFVSTSDGLALYVVHGTSNRPRISHDGSANTRFDVVDGTASILLSDDPGETTAGDGGTSFKGDHSWTRENTDGMVIGPLARSSTVFGQFTRRPDGLDDGWEVISVDGSTIPLRLVPGRRVRLDFN